MRRRSEPPRRVVNSRELSPSSRYESVEVYGNPDGTFRILVIAGAGCFIFASGYQSRENVEWTAKLLKLAIDRHAS